MASTSRSLQENSLLNGRYQITRVLGRGGMGTVYLARHNVLKSDVAIKEISGSNIEDEAYKLALESCEKESEMLFKLDHPNLPKVTDAFIENDRFYLVMEYIDGMTLEAKLREMQGHGLDARQVAEWGLQITDVLGYLHTLNPPIIFRDLKPANIMVQPDGRVRLIDFGIARKFQNDPSKTKDTALLGSVGYSPPEQFGQHQTDHRSDIYAFGATLHHLLTGRDPAAQPFKFPPAASLNPLIPDNFSRLVDRCLALEADKRPADVRDIAMDLLAIRDQLAANPAPLSPSARSGTQVSPNAVTLPSGATTGSRPRIISSKLRDAELRRVSPAAAVFAIVVVLAIIGGTGYALRKPPAATTTPQVTQLTDPTPNTTQPSEPKPDENKITPPVIQSATEAPPPAANNDVVIESVGANVVLETQGAQWLQVQVKGVIKGQNSKPGIVAVFFYDQNNMPLLVPPGTPYTNDQGHLSVAHSLAIEDELYIIDQTLQVPVSAFPKDKPDPTIKYRCVVYVNQERKAETKIIPLKFALPAENSEGNGNPDPNAPNNAPNENISNP